MRILNFYRFFLSSLFGMDLALKPSHATVPLIQGFQKLYLNKCVGTLRSESRKLLEDVPGKDDIRKSLLIVLSEKDIVEPEFVNV